MKQTENNEIDLLLRGLARREGLRSVALEDHSAEHLDADELNSYAEQALPAAARARYTSHLAECASCRKIVSELAASSGTNAREQSVSQHISAGLWQKLGAMFATGPWRYAVPALALFAFIAVGLVALRQRTQPEFIASTQSAETQRQGAIESKQAESTEPNPSAGANDRRQYDQSQTNAGKLRDGVAKTGEQTETSKTVASKDSVSESADKSVSLGKGAGAIAQPSYAPEPAAAPPPKSSAVEIETRTEVATGRKKEADTKPEEGAREQAGARARSDERQNPAQPQSGAGDSLAVKADKRRAAPAPKPVFGVSANSKDEEEQTRTVSGRRFRRQGGIWIDTAFQSSATTVIARGSEQFRALVADEPGIRAIAAQLPGEVVVVWKGRAYRIR